MINLLKKFKKALLDSNSAVVYKTSNYVYLTDFKIKIRIAQSSFINDLFDPLDNFTCYKYIDLLKGKTTILENCLNKDNLFEEFLNIPVFSNLLNLPRIKLSDGNDREVTQHAFIFDGFLWLSDGCYLLRHELPENNRKDIKLNIPNTIWNLFTKFEYIKTKDRTVQIFGLLSKNISIAIEYKTLFNLDSNIDMIKNISKCLDTCDDGAIFDFTDIYKLNLSTKKAENLFKVSEGLISIKNLTFKHTKELIFNSDLKEKVRSFAVDYFYLNKFKKLFTCSKLNTFSRLSSNKPYYITLHQGGNALILACFRD
ncbi:MAG: hypothetical protein VZQ49_00310 [Methanobrevibacter sp.]|nr:hypothetical protein [Methanobrevibacter sp.]